MQGLQRCFIVFLNAVAIGNDRYITFIPVVLMGRNRLIVLLKPHDFNELLSQYVQGLCGLPITIDSL